MSLVDTNYLEDLMKRYVIKNKNTNLYLSNIYYRDLKGCKSMKNAHKFTAFELLLASKTVLENKHNYIVYSIEKFKENSLLEELYD